MTGELPRVGVGVIVMRDGLVLLGQRRGAHGAGSWALPGGHLEFGESVEACAAREVMEETGLTLRALRPGPYTSDVFDAEGRHYVTLFVVAQAGPGEAELREPAKCAGWSWHRWDALPTPLFAPLATLLRAGFAPSECRDQPPAHEGDRPPAAAARAASLGYPDGMAGDMLIKVDDLSGPGIRALLEEHLNHMRELSPPESVHALDIDGLRRPDVTFWSAWDGAVLLGCGALRALDATHGEVKSMRTARAHLRRGTARIMLAHIVDAARARGYDRLSLETGSMAAFAPARALYESFGFTYCAPFGDYVEDPYSVFMTLRLRPAL